MLGLIPKIDQTDRNYTSLIQHGQFMNKKNKLSQSDRSLFDEAMENVKPLKQGNYAPPHKTFKKSQINRSLDDTDCIDYSLSDAQDHHAVKSDEKVSFSTPGVQAKLLKKLRTGKMPIEANLDLHGLTIDQARQQVSRFILSSQSMGKKCVIIIHGKGSIKNSPKLKSMVNHWLKQIPDVLAFSSSQEQHGGTGAVYVLIKTKIRHD